MTTAYANPYTVADAAPTERAAFIRSTYLHLGLAIVAFIGLEWFLLQQSWAQSLISKMTGGFGWLIVLGAFMAVSWIAESFANKTTSLGAQYFGLGLFVVAEAFIFMPLLYIAANFAGDGGVIMKAGCHHRFYLRRFDLCCFRNEKGFLIPPQLSDDWWIRRFGDHRCVNHLRF